MADVGKAELDAVAGYLKAETERNIPTYDPAADAGKKLQRAIKPKPKNLDHKKGLVVERQAEKTPPAPESFEEEIAEGQKETDKTRAKRAEEEKKGNKEMDDLSDKMVGNRPNLVAKIKKAKDSQGIDSTDPYTDK